MFKTMIGAAATLFLMSVSAASAHAVEVYDFQLSDPSQPYRMSQHLISSNYLDSRTYLANGSATLVYDDINATIDLTITTIGSLYAYTPANEPDYAAGPILTGVTSLTTLHFNDVDEAFPFALLGDPDMNKSSGHFSISSIGATGDPSQGADYDIVAKPMDWNTVPDTSGFIDEMRPYGPRTFWMYFAHHNWGDDRFIDPAELVFNFWSGATGPVTAGNATFAMTIGDYHGSGGNDVTTPEPATLLLLGSGLGFLGVRRRKRSV